MQVIGKETMSVTHGMTALFVYSLSILCTLLMNTNPQYQLYYKAKLKPQNKRETQVMALKTYSLSIYKGCKI